MDNPLIVPALVAALVGLAVLVCVLTVALHRSPARRQDALRALEILMGRNPH